MGRWHEWSKGYQVPLQNTTLRGVKVHAAIAGKALTEAVKQRDAIYDLFVKGRGKAKERSFKPEQIELAIMVDEQDYLEAERKREEDYNPKDGESDSDDPDAPFTTTPVSD
jgi:hypothetical protein